MNSKKGSIYFLLVVLSAFLFALAPTLFSHGMFMDGVYYATISRNLAEGIGSFWSPKMTETLANQFHDHPPLVFYLQSLFFRLFGDHHWVERIYSLLTYLIGGGLVIVLWKKVVGEIQKPLYWLPLLLWLTVPKLVWGASNNLLENTMMLFVLGSLIFQIKAIQSKQSYWFFLAGIFLFIGFLAKGVTVFFPLSFPFFYWIFQRNLKLAHLLKSYVLLLSGTFVPLLLLLLFNSTAMASLTDYFDIQLLQGTSQVTEGKSRFYIIRRVSQELSTMGILAAVFFILNKYYFKYPTVFSENKAWVYTLLATALSGVLPILISLKQSTFYAIPTFPIFSIAFALLIAPVVVKWIVKINPNNWQFRLFKALSLLLIVVSSIALLLPINHVGRDKTKLKDLRKIIHYVDQASTVGISKELERQWSYYSYLHRYGHISLTASKANEQAFLICPKGVSIENYKDFEKAPLELKSLDLYQKTTT